MHSVQRVSKQSKLSRRQRKRHRYSAASAASSSSSSLPRVRGYKVAKAYRNTVPIVHGIVVSNLSLVLLQKEYKEQFYFEKRSGGGGPDPDANADLHRHLNKTIQPHIIHSENSCCKFNIQLQQLRFG